MSRTLTFISTLALSCLAWPPSVQAAQGNLAVDGLAPDTAKEVVVEAGLSIKPLSVCEHLLTAVGANETECRNLARSGHPDAPRALSLLSMAALQRNDLAAARADAEAALNLVSTRSTNDGMVQSNYANLLLREARYAEALAAYEAALDDPSLTRADVAGVHLNRALCLRALGRYDAARDAFVAHQNWLIPQTSAQEF